MTDITVLIFGTAAVFIFVFAYCLTGSPRPIAPLPEQPTYEEGLEQMRAAVAGAYREHEPGLSISPDLVDCWLIWSDPPGSDVLADQEPD
ncbi:hypothetical protein ACOKM5_20840 [Streptomyces sp. BH097]|uniref:hypothetical protein n=1 Tax=Streptomyces sp. BH097 TaxID=3410406 RepID=UPI003CF19FB0